MNSKKLSIQQVRENIIGFTTYIQTPYGEKTCLYADQTATGRPFKLIEYQIQNYMKKMIANSHTEISTMGQYSTLLLNYAQNSILKSFGVTSENYFAIPAGFGATGAFEKITKIIPIIKQDDQSQQPIVYITPYEHHSNILPWFESNCKVVMIDSDEIGALNLQFLEQKLKENADKVQIVSVSAASNVTSQKTDIAGINNIIKSLKSICKKIYFNLDSAALLSHDRIYLSFPDYDQIDFVSSSPHKNLGGSESTGLLIGKKSAYGLVNQPPSFPGGGTVKYVTSVDKKDILYDDDIFFREQAGTPNAIGFYRAALSFELEDQIGLDIIKQREHLNQTYFMNGIKAINRQLQDRYIHVYGETENMNNRYDVFSFNIMLKQGKHLMDSGIGEYRILHPHFVSKVLNDVYGIQSRSGCSCAGPFGVKQLLKLKQNKILEFQEQIRNGDDSQKPGWVRVDTFFAFVRYEIDYMLQAIQTITQYSDNIADDYIWQNGVFFHKNQKQLQQFDFSLLTNQNSAQKMKQGKLFERQQKLQEQLQEGQKIFKIYPKQQKQIKQFKRNHIQYKQIDNTIDELSRLQKYILNIPQKTKLPTLKLASINDSQILQNKKQQKYQVFPQLSKRNMSKVSSSTNLNGSFDTQDNTFTYYNNQPQIQSTRNQKNINTNIQNKSALYSRVQLLKQQEDNKLNNLYNFIQAPENQKQIDYN